MERNEYSGCKGLSSIRSLSTATSTARQFFDQFVRTRTPVLFTGQLDSSECKDLPTLWSDQYLKDKCGSCPVKVEYRDRASESFGKGRERSMLFSDFLQEVHNDMLYLTTQELQYNEEGQPTIISPPLTQLRSDFPLSPRIAGNLIVANVNMWYGSSKRPTTSGLHHDYHDNLYCLLRGRKIITLYSPSEALNMYTVGEIAKVHPNGRINYVGQLTTADGSDLHSSAAILASERLTRAADRLAQSKAKSAAENENTNVGEEDAEAEIEDALEAMLDAEMADQEVWSDEEEEYDKAEGENSDDGDSDDDKEEEESDSAGDGNLAIVRALQNNKRKRNSDDSPCSGQAPNIILGTSLSKKVCSSSSAAATVIGSETTSTTHSFPVNFSRVDTSLPDEVLRKEYPLFPMSLHGRIHSQGSSSEHTSHNSAGADASTSTKVSVERGGGGVEVELHAGQMLFIPAGWFHEVRSFSSPDNAAPATAPATVDQNGGRGDLSHRTSPISNSSSNAATSTCTSMDTSASTERSERCGGLSVEGHGCGYGYGGHLALNYWFHPPDSSDFEHPYSNPFWEQDFAERKRSEFY